MDGNIELNKLAEESANENNPKWNQMILREKELYSANTDLRTDFERD